MKIIKSEYRAVLSDDHSFKAVFSFDSQRLFSRLSRTSTKQYVDYFIIIIIIMMILEINCKIHFSLIINTSVFV